MNLNNRLQRLEDQAPELPILCLGQDWHDPYLFRDAAGNEYRRGTPGWPDETRRQLVLVVYADDWHGDGEGHEIQLSWDDHDSVLADRRRREAGEEGR